MNEQKRSQALWIGGVEPSREVLELGMTALYERECREQPERLAGLLRAYAEDQSITAELDKLRQMSLAGGPILLIGMGASYCSALTASCFLQSQGRASFAVDASEWLHYSQPVWDQAAASVLVTASGESAELVKLQRSLPPPVALLCNNETSTCWSLAEIRLPILAGPEYGNATKTYTNATAAGIALTSHILGRRWQDDASQAASAYAASVDQIFARRSELEIFCRGAANIEIIGRGPAFAGAIMSALCIREMTGQRAAPHSGGGFRHGPLLDVNQSHVAIILALGRTAELGVKLAQDCLARGGRVILVGIDELEPGERFMPMKIAAVPEPWEAISSLLVPQALTLAIAEYSGARLAPRFRYGPMTE
jgi:glucosamine--fructose-6-phosphate aminotransferase (isomerizing)